MQVLEVGRALFFFPHRKFLLFLCEFANIDAASLSPSAAPRFKQLIKGESPFAQPAFSFLKIVFQDRWIEHQPGLRQKQETRLRGQFQFRWNGSSRCMWLVSHCLLLTSRVICNNSFHVSTTSTRSIVAI